MAAQIDETVRLLTEAAIVGLPEPDARRRVEERGLLWRVQEVGESVVDASMGTRRVTAILEAGVVIDAYAE
jgi:hypothetical protein